MLCDGVGPCESRFPAAARRVDMYILGSCPNLKQKSQKLQLSIWPKNATPGHFVSKYRGLDRLFGRKVQIPPYLALDASKEILTKMLHM